MSEEVAFRTRNFGPAARRVARVVSCEHDAQWYARTRPLVPAHVELHSIPLEPDGL